ncbi:MAG: hypothetical protein JKX97_02155 [Candidatus Lindowbacteria bacterium]|nr:hypothetical protein [Candidatus Lindowbacteria bacterium]
MYKAVFLTALLLVQAYGLQDARNDLDRGNYDPAINFLSRQNNYVGSGNDEIAGLLKHALRLRAANAYRSGKFDVAVKDLYDLLELHPNDTAVKNDISTVYASLGSELLRNGDTPGAQIALHKSLSYDKTRKDVPTVLAYIAITRGQFFEKAGEMRQAISNYRKALEWDEQNIDAHILLGRLYYEREEHALAKLHLRAARESTTRKIQGLDALLSKVDKEFETARTYQTVELDGFIVRFEGNQRYDLFYQLVPDLQSSRERTARVLERTPRIPLTVILYSGGQFQRNVDAPDWAAGTYDGKIRIRDVELGRPTSELQRIIKHEVAHAVIESAARKRVPGWVHEGIAKYMEGNSWDPPQDVHYLVRGIKAQKVPSLVAMNTTFGNLPAGTDVRLAYAQSSAAIRYMTAIYGEPVLAEFISLLSSGRTVVQAIDTITFQDLGSFQKRVNEWVLWEYDR